MRALLATIVFLALAGCGEEDDQAVELVGDTHLELVIRPKGDDGPVRRKTVTRPPRGLKDADFKPVDPMTACTQIYGGPATATVRGTLRGSRIDATFSRENGCEIARWDRVEELLGRAPGPTLR